MIPPAWTQVWICPAPNGHIQAVGTDDAGRRQYLYHPVWREQRDGPSTTACSSSPAACRRPAGSSPPTSPSRGCRRNGRSGPPSGSSTSASSASAASSYAEDNGSYGLATIEKQHVHVSGDEVVFDYPAKSGQERLIAVADPAVIAAVSELRARRGGGRELLAFRDGKRWRDLSSTDINRYVKDVVGGDVSAKDFRTWHGTVLAAVALADRADDVESATRRKKAVRTAMVEVAQYLGNTPTVARGSYVDPRVIDAFESGTTIAPTLAKLGRRRRDAERSRDAIERAVLKLLRD